MRLHALVAKDAIECPLFMSTSAHASHEVREDLWFEAHHEMSPI